MAKKSSKKDKKEEVVEEQVKSQAEEISTEEETDQPKGEMEEEEVEKKEEEVQEVSEVDTLKNQVKEVNDKYLRLVAEYDNYRKRTLKERMELTKSAGEGLLLGLLPVVDDFDRALSHLGDASDLDSVKHGIDLIYNKFKEFLKQNGVSEIESKDKDFDTDLHEAITKIPAPTEEMKGKVIDCVEKGYVLNGKVMRFAKVVVGE